MWIVELLSGVIMWLAAVIGFTLFLSGVAYCYFEGAPEVIVFMKRVVGNLVRIVAMGVREVLEELAAITLIPYLLTLIPYALGVTVFQFWLIGNSSVAFIVAMFAASLDSYKKEWTRLVFFVWLGVMVLMLQVVDPYSPILTLLMWITPTALALSTATALGMMGASRGREGLMRSQAGRRRREDGDGGGSGGLTLVKAIFSQDFASIESDAVLPLVRPIALLFVAAYLVIKGYLSWAFVMCLIAAIVEITNEKWFNTVAFSSLGVVVLVLESAPMEASALTSAVMLISPIAVAGIAVNEPQRTAQKPE
jgi:hypothetical protein